MHECVNAIAAADLSNPAKWWENCEQILRAFSELVGVNRILVFTRRMAHFVQQVPLRETAQLRSIESLLRMSFLVLPSDKLYLMYSHPTVRTLAQRLELSTADAAFYVTITPAEPSVFPHS